MSTHNLCLLAKVRKILLYKYTHVKPTFPIYEGLSKITKTFAITSTGVIRFKKQIYCNKSEYTLNRFIDKNNKFS